MARKSFKAGALTAPLPPVMVTVGDMENSNIITIGWTGILSTIPPRTYISVRPQRHSYGILKRTGEFVINLTTASQARVVDYAGIYTGAKVDKFKECKLTKVESKEVAAPTIGECPLALECRVIEVIPMGTHDVFIADIVSVSCDEAILDDDGKICFDKAGLLAYAHGEYFALGEKVGKFGFSTKKASSNKSQQKKPAGAGNKPKGVPVTKNTESEENKKRPFYLDAPRGKSNKNKGGKKR
jgi:flavin reductase (DIM6/NTAB) family NADH-FMN oxidoreductase RutF